MHRRKKISPVWFVRLVCLVHTNTLFLQGKASHLFPGRMSLDFMTNSYLCTAFCSIHMIFTQQQLLKVPVCACSTFSAANTWAVHRKEPEKQKGPFTLSPLQKQHSVRPSVWALLLPSCHQRSKFILPTWITEKPTAKFQRATDPKWRPCSGTLRTSSASSECCPVITGERERRQNITQKYFCDFFLQLLLFFFFFFPSLSKS